MMGSLTGLKKAWKWVKIAEKWRILGEKQSSDLRQVLNCCWLITNIAYGWTFKLGPQAMTRGSLTGLQEAWKWGQNCWKMTFFGGKSIIWPPAIFESPLVDYKYCLRLDLQIWAPSDDEEKPNRPPRTWKRGKIAEKWRFLRENQSSDLQQVLNRHWLITIIAYGLTFQLGPQAMI